MKSVRALQIATFLGSELIGNDMPINEVCSVYELEKHKMSFNSHGIEENKQAKGLFWCPKKLEQLCQSQGPQACFRKSRGQLFRQETTDIGLKRLFKKRKR